MGEHQQTCVWCRGRHGRRFLCDSAMAVLDRALERGREGTMPTLVLDEPIPLVPDPAADTLVGQLVVQAGVIPGPGVYHPAVVLTGRDAEGHQLPKWIYVADDDNLRRAAPLVHEMTELAIRRADERNGAR